MNSFTRGAMSNNTLTNNGAITHSTSDSALVDLFGTIGSLRQRTEEEIISMFSKAFGENPLDALKILFWARDIRGGSGERRTFRTCLKWLADSYPEVVIANINLIPFYGRWDDLHCLMGTHCETAALMLWKAGLEAKDGLCAKWAPRLNSKNHAIAYKLRSYLGLTEKQYRKLLSSLSKTVEQQMCANQWSEITYAHVPSLAMNHYRKAFGKHDQERFAQYLESVKKGEAKIHAGTLYPHDIVAKYLSGAQKDDVLEEQWKALPDYLVGNTERIMPLLDVSGSMCCGAVAPRPIDVCISLGCYIAERNVGPFKDYYIEFSGRSEMHKLQGYSLRDRVYNMSRCNWGGNTDIQGAYELILRTAIQNRVPESDMPTMLLCFSDMEWDPSGFYATNHNVLKAKYAAAGYRLPKIVYWNLNGRAGNSPVKSDENGTALISGFSPAIMKSILAGKDFTPWGIMRQTIDDERYAKVQTGWA